MQIITTRDGGMFPAPREISLDCSCPDSAGMCKHIAAVMYGVGARLDEKPELFFKLRQVDHLELIEQAGNVQAITGGKAAGKKTIAATDLADCLRHRVGRFPARGHGPARRPAQSEGQSPLARRPGANRQPAAQEATTRSPCGSR